MAQTTAEYLVEQGKKIGAIQEKRNAVLNLLRLRFRTVPEPLTRRIKLTQSQARLDALFNAAAIAETLEEIDWGDGKG